MADMQDIIIVINVLDLWESIIFIIIRFNNKKDGESSVNNNDKNKKTTELNNQVNIQKNGKISAHNTSKKTVHNKNLEV